MKRVAIVVCNVLCFIIPHYLYASDQSTNIDKTTIEIRAYNDAQDHHAAFAIIHADIKREMPTYAGSFFTKEHIEKLFTNSLKTSVFNKTINITWVVACKNNKMIALCSYYYCNNYGVIQHLFTNEKLSDTGAMIYSELTDYACDMLKENNVTIVDKVIRPEDTEAKKILLAKDFKENFERDDFKWYGQWLPMILLEKRLLKEQE